MTVVPKTRRFKFQELAMLVIRSLPLLGLLSFHYPHVSTNNRFQKSKASTGIGVRRHHSEAFRDAIVVAQLMSHFHRDTAIFNE